MVSCFFVVRVFTVPVYSGWDPFAQVVLVKASIFNNAVIDSLIFIYLIVYVISDDVVSAPFKNRTPALDQWLLVSFP